MMSSQGANELIRNGAILVQDLDDVLEHLGEVGAKMTPEKEELLPRLPDVTDATEKSLLEALAGGPANLDELVRSTGLASSKVLSTMTMLVLKGRVSQQAGNVFERRVL